MINKYNQRVNKCNSLVCVGLDADLRSIPDKFKKERHPQFSFNKHIIDQTHDLVSAYKANSAFYESSGFKGMEELKMTVRYLQENHPDIYLICDAKRADIENTNSGYVSSFFDFYGFDAITINPYLGKESIMPFLERKGKDSIILCRTSNKGANELQDLLVSGKPLWYTVLEHVVNDWNKNENCLVVMGATSPAELKIARLLSGNMTFLVPGIGKQGGNIKEVICNGINNEGRGLIINSSRGIIFSDNPRKEAKSLRDTINKYKRLTIKKYRTYAFAK